MYQCCRAAEHEHHVVFGAVTTDSEGFCACSLFVVEGVLRAHRLRELMGLSIRASARHCARAWTKSRGWGGGGRGYDKCKASALEIVWASSSRAFGSSALHFPEQPLPLRSPGLGFEQSAGKR